MTTDRKPSPPTTAYLCYVAHWAFMSLCEEYSPMYESSWDAIHELEARYNWDGLFKELRQKARI